MRKDPSSQRAYGSILTIQAGGGLIFNSLKPTNILSTLEEALSSKCISLERLRNRKEKKRKKRKPTTKPCT
jgi:hypothetical protein